MALSKNAVLPLEVAEDWQVVEMGEVLSQVARKMRIESNQAYVRLGVRWYAQGPFQKDMVFGADLKGTNLFQVRTNDFIYNRLFAWKGSFGVVPGIMNECYVSSEFPTFQADHSICEPEFVWRWFSLPQIWRMIEDKSTGSTRTSRLRFKENDFLRLPIPLPPLPEQRRIGHVLSTIQRAIQAQDAVIAAARELKRSLMHRLFTYGPYAEPLPTKETDIGEVPEKWEMMHLQDIAKIGNGSTPQRTNPDYWQGGTFPWLTSSRVHDIVIRHAEEYVTELALQECHLPIVPKGSIVVAITGQGKTLGNSAITTFDTTINQHLAYLRIQRSGIVPEFVLQYLLYHYQDLRQAGRAGGSTKAALTCGYLKSYPVTCPTLSEQQSIASSLMAITEKVDAEEKRRSALEALFKSMLYQLMTGQVRALIP